MSRILTEFGRPFTGPQIINSETTQIMAIHRSSTFPSATLDLSERKRLPRLQRQEGNRERNTRMAWKNVGLLGSAGHETTLNDLLWDRNALVHWSRAISSPGWRLPSQPSRRQNQATNFATTPPENTELLHPRGLRDCGNNEVAYWRATGRPTLSQLDDPRPKTA